MGEQNKSRIYKLNWGDRRTIIISLNMYSKIIRDSLL